MIEIHVNGKPLSLPDDSTVADALLRVGVSGRYAVEINHDIVPRSRLAAMRLQAGDRVEIVQAIGGG